MQTPTPLPPLRIPLRRPAGLASRRRAGVALGISAGVHVLAVVMCIAAVRHAQDADSAGRSRAPTVPAEQVEYLDVGAWPRVSYVLHPPSPPGVAALPGVGEPVSGVGSSDTVSSMSVGPDGGGTADAAAPGAAAAEGAAGQGSAPSPDETGRVPPGGRMDPRLVVPGQPVTARPVAGDEPYLAQFRAALRAFNDSIQDQSDRDRRAASWTWTDPRGRAWGFRQGVLMIAGQGTINVEMQGERAQELLARQQARARREGQAQAERIERGRYLQERGRATRERRGAERRSRAP